MIWCISNHAAGYFHTMGTTAKALLHVSICALKTVSSQWSQQNNRGKEFFFLHLSALKWNCGYWYLQYGLTETPSLFQCNFPYQNLLLSYRSSLPPLSVSHLVIPLVLYKNVNYCRTELSHAMLLHKKFDGTWQSKMFRVRGSLSVSLLVSEPCHLFPLWPVIQFSLSAGFQNGWAKMRPPSPSQSESQNPHISS